MRRGPGIVYRWLYLDHRITYVPNARIFHSHDLNLGSFWKQHFNYGTGARRYWERKTRHEQASMTVEPLSFYLELISYAWSKKRPRPLSLSFLMLLSQFANTAGFMRAKLFDR